MTLENESCGKTQNGRYPVNRERVLSVKLSVSLLLLLVQVFSLVVLPEFVFALFTTTITSHEQVALPREEETGGHRDLGLLAHVPHGSPS